MRNKYILETKENVVNYYVMSFLLYDSESRTISSLIKKRPEAT